MCIEKTQITDTEFVKGFVRMCEDGWRMGWHERNGGNLSYRIKDEEIEKIMPFLNEDKPWTDITAKVPGLSGEFFLVTGSGKYFRNVPLNPAENIAIIEINSDGDKYRIRWGLENGGKPTSELPSHLLNHEVKKRVSNGRIRVVYHAHPANIIALTFILPIDDQIFTRELWEMITECAMVFPEGVGVLPWMVCGSPDIGIKTSKLMEKYNVAIWAYHGMFCCEEDFDLTFGLMNTVEKAAEILMKVLSVRPDKRQSVSSDNLRELAKAYNLPINEEFLD